MRQIALSGIVLAASLVSASAADPLGEWRVNEKVATIKIVDCNSRLWGVLASELRPGIDKENPDPAKRNRPTLGIPIIINMAKVADERDKWQGEIYNAKEGKTYKASIQLKAPNSLEVRGCVLGFLCGGETWTRVVDAASGTLFDPTTGAPQKAAPAPVPPPAAAAAPPPPKAAAPAKGTPPKGTASSSGPVSEVCLLPDIAGAAH